VQERRELRRVRDEIDARVQTPLGELDDRSNPAQPG
jgi:hypothetical protein